MPKDKVNIEQGMKAPRGEYNYNANLSSTLALEWSGWSNPIPGRFALQERDPVPLV